MTRGVFITGTDTDVGKSVICGLLGAALKDQGQKVITQKWIQTGCTGFPEDLDTHLAYMDQTRESLSPWTSLMSPYVFDLPASAHLAAEHAGQAIDPDKIIDAYRALTDVFDSVVVEGIGGAMVPYSRQRLVLDIVGALDLPVVIVAKNKLGTINHTLLTIEAIRSRQLKLLGVIFNGKPSTDDPVINDNPDIVSQLSETPVLGDLPWNSDSHELKQAFKPIGQALYEQLDKS